MLLLSPHIPKGRLDLSHALLLCVAVERERGLRLMADQHVLGERAERERDNSKGTLECFSVHPYRLETSKLYLKLQPTSQAIYEGYGLNLAWMRAAQVPT